VTLGAVFAFADVLVLDLFFHIVLLVGCSRGLTLVETNVINLISVDVFCMIVFCVVKVTVGILRLWGLSSGESNVVDLISVNKMSMIVGSVIKMSIFVFWFWGSSLRKTNVVDLISVDILGVIVFCMVKVAVLVFVFWFFTLVEPDMINFISVHIVSVIMSCVIKLSITEAIISLPFRKSNVAKNAASLVFETMLKLAYETTMLSKHQRGRLGQTPHRLQGCRVPS